MSQATETCARKQGSFIQGQRGDADGGANEESEAGPEAVAAVQQAMQQYGQDDDDDENPQGARQLEQMMNAMIEQAYDEEMEVRLYAICNATSAMFSDKWLITNACS